MFRTDTTLEQQLFAFTPRDLVPENCDIYLYIDIFDQLDLDEFSARYSPQGQDSVDPRLMLRTIFYGLTHFTATGRKLEAACKFDNRYLVLCGGHTPSYRCFHRFFQRHEQDLHNLFADVVRLAQAMNLVSLGNVAIDGTKIKGHTSRDKTIRYQKVDRAIAAINDEIATLKKSLQEENHTENNLDLVAIPKEILQRENRLKKIKQAKDRLEKEAKYKEKKVSEKAQISVNDPDARGFCSNNGKERYIHGYNMQAAVDERAQIILAADICDSTNDHDAFEPLLNQTKDLTQQYPQAALVDSGYLKTENLSFAEDKEIFPCISVNKEEERSRLNEVVFVEENKFVECRNGIRFEIRQRDKKTVYFKVTDNDETCGACPFMNSCAILKRKGKRFYLPSADRHRYLTAHWQRSREETFKELYKRRKAIVEPVFGNIKVNKALQLFRTGRKNALNWWKIACTAHNLEKIAKAIGKPAPILI